MPKYETAKIVKEFRSRKQLSQETLGKKVDYDQQSISLIEAGKHTPAKQALEKILETTDAPMSKFNRPVSEKTLHRARLERCITICIDHNDFEINNLIWQYENCTEKMDKYQMQFFLYAKATFDAHHHADSSQIMDNYIKAIRETFHDFSLDPVTDFTRHHLLLTEIKILLGISTILYKTGESKQLTQLLSLIENYLNEHAGRDLELEQYAMLYPAIADLYVQCLFANGNFELALKIATNGVDCCTQYGILQHLTNLSFYRGLSFTSMNNIIEGKEILCNTLLVAEATDLEET